MELILNDSKIPTLCLNMIVKNESRIIKRLFDSVISIIDSYCICDTGSTDNTIEIIEDYFKEKGKPGKVVREPFKNFCHNRNFSLQACIGLSDYVLFLDADMILEINNFNKALLSKANSFNILQGNDSFCYQNLRIVKNNGLYKYVGVTHEYIDTPNDNIIMSFKKQDIFIRDIGDGGSKNNKFERDIRLLLDGIKEEPNNVRYYFYLANSYYDLGRFGEAINVYKKRIEFGGWKEEVWYSYYRIGLCFKNMNKFVDALFYWLEGYDYYPERLEALYEIIKHYRLNGKNKLCMKFYNMAKEILEKNENRDSYLFLHNDIYTHKIYYEYTIFAAYNGIKDINKEFVTIFNNLTYGAELENILCNMKFYKQVLQKNTLFNANSTINSTINGEDIKFISSSSCLIKNPNSDGYLLNVRYVNYYIEENGSYKNCEKHIISINKFVELGKNLNIIKEQWMDLLFDGRLYIGVEDIKIFYDIYKEKLLFIGTGYHSNNQIGIVSGEYNTMSGKLNSNELKQDFNRTSCEKNWVFVDYKNDLHIIYDWYPLRICKLENNKLNVVETKNTPKMFSRVRGSSCGYVYNKKIGENANGNITIDIVESEIWFINHIVSYESPRHYYHIISVFDSNMNLLHYSAPFKFEGEPIEYSLSIVVEDERVLINYSVWDRTTKIASYDKKYINSLLLF
jgi:glycosyltransferase involved in cell wall biosynthesis